MSYILSHHWFKEEPYPGDGTRSVTWLSIGMVVVNPLVFAVAWGVIQHQEQSESSRD